MIADLTKCIIEPSSCFFTPFLNSCLNLFFQEQEEAEADDNVDEESEAAEDEEEISPVKEKAAKVEKSKAKPKAVPKAKASGDDAKTKSSKSSSKTYEEMIMNAIKELKSRTGSSRQAIFKFLKETHSFGQVSEKRILLNVSNALKKGLEKGVFKMAKEAGKGSGCYKLGDKGLEMLKKANAKAKPKPKKDVKKKETSKKATSKPKAKSKEDAGVALSMDLSFIDMFLIYLL